MIQCESSSKTLLNKRSPKQKTAYHMIPFIWSVQKRQIYGYRIQISSCLIRNENDSK